MLQDGCCGSVKRVQSKDYGKHKKVEQALERSLHNLFEQLAWRTSPAAVRHYRNNHHPCEA